MVFLALAPKHDEILHLLRSIVVPLVEADGGQVFVVPSDNGRVVIHLAGHLAGSPGISLVARRIFEPAVRAIAPEASVVLSSGCQIPQGAVSLHSEG